MEMQRVMREDALIIGAGQAAAQLTASLRQGGFDKPISIIGDEPYPPYQRPPLSKKFLSENGSPESLFLRPAGFWHDQEVVLHLGSGAAQVDLRQRRVSLRDGRELDFGVLVFATGTRARTLPLPGIGLHFRCETSMMCAACAPRSIRRAASPSSAVATSALK